MSEYHKHSAGVTPTNDTDQGEDEALEQLDWVVPAVFLGAALILFLAVVGWWAPLVPLLVFVGLVWVPVSATVVWASSDNASPKKLGAAVGILGLFALPLLAWSVDGYRIMMLSVGNNVLQASTAVQAIDDPSEQVALLACEMELESEDSTRHRRLPTALQDRPHIAVECLSSATEENQRAVSRISSDLFDSWYAGWMGESPVDEQIACHHAEYARALGGLVDVDVRPELLMCALEAESETIAACCGETATAYAREEGVENVDPPRWSRPIQEPLFQSLSAVTDVPSSTLASDDPLVDTLGWRPMDLWHWTLELGCYRVVAYHDTDGAGVPLAELTDRQCDTDGGDPRHSSSERSILRRSCGQVREIDSRLDVDRWCEISEGERVRAAVSEADRAVARTLLGVESRVVGDEMLEHFSSVADAIEGSPMYVSDGEGGVKISSEFQAAMRQGHVPEWTRESGTDAEFRDMMSQQYEQRHEIRAAMEQQRRVFEQNVSGDDEGRQQMEQEFDEMEDALQDVERLHRQGPPR